MFGLYGEVVDVALLEAICVKFTSTDRPTMRQVEMTLEGIHAAKDFDSSGETDDEEDFIQMNDPSFGVTDMEATSLDFI